MPEPALRPGGGTEERERVSLQRLLLALAPFRLRLSFGLVSRTLASRTVIMLLLPSWPPVTLVVVRLPVADLRAVLAWGMAPTPWRGATRFREGSSTVCLACVGRTLSCSVLMGSSSFFHFLIIPKPLCFCQCDRPISLMPVMAVSKSLLMPVSKSLPYSSVPLVTVQLLIGTMSYRFAMRTRAYGLRCSGTTSRNCLRQFRSSSISFYECSWALQAQPARVRVLVQFALQINWDCLRRILKYRRERRNPRSSRRPRCRCII